MSLFGALEDTGGSWPGIWHLDLDLDMVNGLLKPMLQILALYFDFEGAKNIHVL